MKKILALLLSLIIALNIPVAAFGAQTAEISLNKVSSDEEKIVIEVDISDKGSPCVMQFCIAYDSSVLECESAVSGDAFEGISVPLINKTDGKIYFIWDALMPLEDGGNLLKLEFTPKAPGKNVSVRIDDSEEFIIADNKYNEIGSVKGPLNFVTEGTAVENPVPESSSSSEESAEEKPSENSSSEEQIPENTPSEETESIPDSSDSNTSVMEETEKLEETDSSEKAEENTSSGQEENVLEVTSPREDKKKDFPLWIPAAAVAAAAAISLLVIKTRKKGN